jgi:GntR family phosphonate transport system transcriptional regulator
MKRTKKTPLWQAIAQALRSDIADKIYGAGDKLPTEAELAKRFGVNRHTVRHAVSGLVDEGLLRTRRGAGVFVIGELTEYSIGKRVRFHQNILSVGQTPEKRILQIEERAASRREADVLHMKSRGDLCVCHGLSLANGTPIALFSSHFPAERLPGMAAALEAEQGVTAALAHCGVSDYTRASTRISARLANATQALHLHVQEGAPLIYSTSLNVDEAGLPVEFGMTWFAGDRVTLTMEEEG